jgi:hypothetical protein
MATATATATMNCAARRISALCFAMAPQDPTPALKPNRIAPNSADCDHAKGGSLV